MKLDAGDSRVGDFYESHPYPPPVDDVAAYRRRWDDHRRRCDAHLFWPGVSDRGDRSILVAGCGTVQAVHYALRWPRARIVGIDSSVRSLEFARALKRRHVLHNLELHQLTVERVGELECRFDRIVCTGVLHHLADPPAALRTLRDVLAVGGALHLMVYAPYGRAGVYLLQEYCRRLGVGWSPAEIDDVLASLKALPESHPIVPLLRTSPDFADRDALADALLHPRDRAYSVPQLMELLSDAGFVFGRWVRQAPYLPDCGALAATPHARILARMSPVQQYAAVELFRGSMLRHSAIAYRSDAPAESWRVSFEGEAWRSFVPLRLPETVTVRERLPAGAAAVLINRSHAFPDLYLPLDARQDDLFAAVDGRRTLGELSVRLENRDADRNFFRRLYRWDHVVFDSSKGGRENGAKESAP